MKKNLLDYDLQLFADEAEGVEESTTAESTEEETSEETTEAEGEETGETDEGNAEPTEQSAEENARYAAIRRRAEEEAKRKYESQMAAYDNEIAAMCQGVKHPLTGQPITNAREYFDALKIQQRQMQEAELKEKGVDPGLIDRMVASNPTVIQAQQMMEQMKQQEDMAQLQRDIEEISKLDPNVKTAEDLYNAPYRDQIISYAQQHNTSLTDAYKILQFENIRTIDTDAARQQAINQMRGKSHLPSQTQGVATENDDVEVPAEIMARFKADGKSEKQIKELYKRVPH